jgi:hypothetical protein
MFYIVNKKQTPLAFLLQQCYAAWPQTVIDAKRDSLWDMWMWTTLIRSGHVHGLPISHGKRLRAKHLFFFSGSLGEEPACSLMWAHT